MLSLKEQERILIVMRDVVLTHNWVPRLPGRGECCLMTALDRACYETSINRYSVQCVTHRLMSAIPDREWQSTLARWNDRQKDVAAITDLIDRALDKLRRERLGGAQ